MTRTPKETLDLVIDPLRIVARGLGYAISVHGSLSRDIDLVATPWINDSVPQGILAEALRLELQRLLGWAFSGSDGPFPRKRPHGRLCWTFHVPGTYVDLSVFPPDGRVEDCA